jgi:hypothetical protein
MGSCRIRTSLAAALAAVSLLSAVWAADQPPAIRLNSLGYLPDHEKKACIATTCSQFAVIRVKDGSKVFGSVTTGPILNSDT